MSKPKASSHADRERQAQGQYTPDTGSPGGIQFADQSQQAHALNHQKQRKYQ